MQEIKGNCQYVVEEAISNKTGNSYKRLKVILNGEEFYKFILLDNRDIKYIEMLLKGVK